MYISAAEFNMIISALTFAIPTIEEWVAETKRAHTVGLDVFPAEAIERAHDFLGDLWLDNERAGDNNPDGTFNTRK